MYIYGVSNISSKMFSIVKSIEKKSTQTLHLPEHEFINLYQILYSVFFPSLAGSGKRTHSQSVPVLPNFATGPFPIPQPDPSQ